MPLRRADSVFVPDSHGVAFVMSDAGKADVVCFVEDQALRAAAVECGIATDDPGEIFVALRRAVEECASDVYDREGAGGGTVVIHPEDLLA